MAAKKKVTDRHKVSTSQLLNFVKDSYLERTSRPLYAILFLLPFIVFYELGTFLINTDILNQSQVRVVAFVWLQEIFRYAGCDDRLAWVAPPLVVIVVLFGLQLASRKPWSFHPHDVAPMAAECVLLAVPLIVLSLFLNTHFQSVGQPSGLRTRLHGQHAGGGERRPVGRQCRRRGGPVRFCGPYQGSLLASVVTGIGAGIYEELVFRLILMCLLVCYSRTCSGPPTPTQSSCPCSSQQPCSAPTTTCFLWKAGWAPESPSRGRNLGSEQWQACISRPFRGPGIWDHGRHARVLRHPGHNSERRVLPVLGKPSQLRNIFDPDPLVLPLLLLVLRHNRPISGLGVPAVRTMPLEAEPHFQYN